MAGEHEDMQQTGQDQASAQNQTDAAMGVDELAERIQEAVYLEIWYFDLIIFFLKYFFV